jgi:hypothetical protein
MNGSGARVTLPLDWSGHLPDTDRVVPAPRPAADEPPPGLADSPLTRMVLARARVRAMVPLDVVTFGASCPGCGQDCEWVQERQDTRLRSTVRCSCQP